MPRPAPEPFFPPDVWSVMSGWYRKRRNTPAERARARRYQSREYRAAERHLMTVVQAGEGFCWRCGRWLDPTATVQRGSRVLRVWHVGHDDFDTDVIRGAECEGCNLRAASRKGAAVRNGMVTARAL